MATKLGTELGTRLGAELGQGTNSLAARFLELLALKALFAFEARSNTNDGTNVQTFVDLIDPTRIMTVTGTLPKPVATAGFGGALACAFTGAQRGTCNRAASEFIRLHNGTGAELRSLFRPSSVAAGQIVLCTRSTTGPGVIQYVAAGGGMAFYITGDAGTIAEALGPTIAANTSYAIHDKYTEPSPIAAHATGLVDIVGSRYNPPSVNNPTLTLRLGGDETGAGLMTGAWFGSYGFLSLTTAERALLDAYTTSATGIVNP